MQLATGYFYDGQTSQRLAVTLQFDDQGSLHIIGGDTAQVYPLAELKISSRLGNTPRMIQLPDGGKCETTDNDIVDDVLKTHGKNALQRMLHIMESRMQYVAAAFVLTIVLVWGWVEYGIPWLAYHAAHAMPTETNVVLSGGTLELLDDLFLQESKLDVETQERLTQQFNAMTAMQAEAFPYELLFRGGGEIGANALALPSGQIILTDELVELAASDEEVIAVLAHEIGHVVHRHGLRSVLQNSAAGLLVASLTGDIVSLSAMSAALPTILLEAKFSRIFEREADQFAVEQLQAQGVSPQHLGSMLQRLSEAYGESDEESASLSYLSSHPATAERVRQINSAATLCEGKDC